MENPIKLDDLGGFPPIFGSPIFSGIRAYLDQAFLPVGFA